MIQVTRLQVAPVKALATMSCERISLDSDGVAEDRRLFLLGADDKVLTLREHPSLAQVRPHLDLAEGKLQLTFPEGSATTAGLDDLGGRVEARLFGKDRSGRVVQGPLADALSRYVGRPVRLVLADRVGVGWDEGPVSLVSRASADALRPPGDAISRSRRFRMLIEVDGVDAHGEDAWVGHRVRIGGAIVGVTHTLYRCVVINQDPDDPHEVWPGLHKLAEHRASGRLTLGVIADVDAPGSICVGDTLEVLSAYTRHGAQSA